MDEHPTPVKEEEKPQKITIELTIPTRETVLEGIKALFPTVAVKVVEEKDEPEA